MADALKYGDKIHLQNGYDSWKGGYLDTNGVANCGGNKYNVSTADSPTRATGTGTWEITSVTGKSAGAEVLSGDVIYLQNQYQNDGGYLDTCGPADCGGNKYLLSTSPAKDRAAGTGRWRVFAESSSPTDGTVRYGDLVHLLNGYEDWNGGFLDTCGAGPSGGKYGVSTSSYLDRGAGANAPGTGTWKFSKA
jgi:hypothetical protein